MNKKDKKELEELKQYIKNNILNYSDSIAFPRYMTSKLQCMAVGKDKYTKNDKIIYDFQTIKKCFIYCSSEIQQIISKVNINDEKHKVNLIMMIVSRKINDFQIGELKKTKNKEKEDVWDLNNYEISNIQKKEYVPKTERGVNEDLWEI